MKRFSDFRRFCALAAAVTLATTAFAAAPAGPGDQPDGPPDAGHEQTAVTLAGRVESFNLNEQRGTLDGLILVNNGQRAQVNLPESLVDAVSKAVAVGDVVQATVVTEGGPGAGRGGPGRGGRGDAGGQPGDGRGPPQEQAADHPVFRAQSVRDAHGQVYTSTDQGPGGPGGGKDATVMAGIKAFNYDHRGTINGLQLVNGDFVRLPGNAASDLNVKPGDQVSVEGNVRPMASGKGNIIEAKTLNGTELHGGPGGPGGPGGEPPPPDGGPDGRGGPPPPGGAGGRGGRGGPPGSTDRDADFPPQEADPGPPPPDEDMGPEEAQPPGPDMGPEQALPPEQDMGPEQAPQPGPGVGPEQAGPGAPMEGPPDAPEGPGDDGNGPDDQDQL